MLRYFSVALALLVVSKSEAYKYSIGKCARVDTQPNFNMKQMFGNWYVIAATSTGKRCLTYWFGNKFGHPDTFLLTETFPPSDTAAFFGKSDDYHRTGTLNILDRNNLAVMSYKTPHESESYKFSVLATDYNRYALIYACKRMTLGFRRWSAMLLSRTPWIEDDIVAKARSVLGKFHIDISSLNQINHARCETKTMPKPSLDEIFNMIFKKPSNTTKPVLKKPEVVITTTTPTSNIKKAKMMMMMNDKPLFIPL